MKQIKIQLTFMLALVLLFACRTQVAAQQKTTYVIVHGAWGGSWSFKNVASQLQQKGHTVYRPSLTGNGERFHLASPDIDLNTHILDVVNTILFEELDDIILVGHSYGGMVITGVADSIPERISKLVYLDAFAPNDGESAMTAPHDGRTGPERDSQDGFVVPNWVDAHAPAPRDVPQSLKTFTTPVKRKKPATLALPATYILTTDDAKHPERDHFYFFAERAKQRGWKMLTMEADHNPQWSKVSELVELLDKE